MTRFDSSGNIKKLPTTLELLYAIRAINPRKLHKPGGEHKSIIHIQDSGANSIYLLIA